jgi:hypothetical protein
LFQLAAFSEDELDGWLHFFNSPDPNRQKEGWLMVRFTFKGWYGTTDRWEMRYFNMHGPLLEFSKREQHVRSVVGVINI